MTIPPARRPILAIAILFTVTALAVTARFPHDTLWSPDCNLKYLQAQILRWDHGFRFDVPYPGRTIDPDLRYVPLGRSFYTIKNGQIRIVWPLTFALLVQPFFRLFGFLGIFVVPILSGGGIVFVSGLLAERIRPGRGPIASALVGAATPILTYSCLFWEHTLATLLALTGIYLLAPTPVAPTSERPTASKKRWVGAALLGVAATALRADLYTLSAATLGALLLVDRERILTIKNFGKFFVAGAFVFWIVNVTSSGHLLPLNAAKNFTTPSLEYLRSSWTELPRDFLVGDTVTPDVGWHFTACAALLLLVAAVRRISWTVRSVLAAPLLLALAHASWVARGEIFSMQLVCFHGLMIGAPIVAVSAFCVSNAKDNDTSSFLRWLVVLYAFVYLAAICPTTPSGPNGGGLELGPRFVVTAFPLLAILATTFELPGRAARAIFLGAAAPALAVSILFQFAALTTIRSVAAKSAPDSAAERSREDVPFLTDLWWLPILDSAHLSNRPTFVVESEKDIGDWVRAATSKGAHRFLFATFIAPENHPTLDTKGGRCRVLGRVSADGNLPMWEIECGS